MGFELASVSRVQVIVLTPAREALRAQLEAAQPGASGAASITVTPSPTETQPGDATAA